MLKERTRVQRERLTAATFGAWQVLRVQVTKPPKWGSYLDSMGLSEKEKLSKEDLKRESDQAMANVQKIVAKAAQNGSR